MSNVLRYQARVHAEGHIELGNIFEDVSLARAQAWSRMRVLHDEGREAVEAYIVYGDESMDDIDFSREWEKADSPLIKYDPDQDAE